MTNDETIAIIIKCVSNCTTLDQLTVLGKMHSDQPRVMRAIRSRKNEIKLGL